MNFLKINSSERKREVVSGDYPLKRQLQITQIIPSIAQFMNDITQESFSSRQIDVTTRNKTIILNNKQKA